MQACLGYLVRVQSYWYEYLIQVPKVENCLLIVQNGTFASFLFVKSICHNETRCELALQMAVFNVYSVVYKFKVLIITYSVQPPVASFGLFFLDLVAYLSKSGNIARNDTYCCLKLLRNVQCAHQKTIDWKTTCDMSSFIFLN